MINKKKLRGAIVGFGFISSKGHMPAYLERIKGQNDVEIIAVCDICPARLTALPPEIKFYTDYQEMLEKEAGNLDFIDVSTHAADHYKISKAALLKGINVLCEKPLTTSIAEAHDLITTAVQCKKVLFPCHNYKHAPVIKAIRELVLTGKIGKVHAVTLHTFRNTHAVGVSEWNPHWRRQKELSGGGIAMDHGSHSLYLIFEWLKGYPKSVTASAINLTFPKYDTEDNFSAVYEFENGFANVHLSWTAGARKVIYTLQGEKGAITVDDDQMQLTEIIRKEDADSSHKAEWNLKKYSISSEWMDSSHTGWFNSMFDRFKIAIENNDFKNNEIMDAYFCVQAIMKSYESITRNSAKLVLENTIPKI
ncbi:MAG: Gfo/Idh/MocA family oxidoreductase [Bacteriovorax sp.]|jgi:predicted dehydrogenase